MNLAPIYLSDEIRDLESRAQVPSGTPTLMERAGLAAAGAARNMLGDQGRRILVVAGPGNNGGDAFEAATHLRRWFYRVDVAFIGNPGKLSADAAKALCNWQEAGGSLLGKFPGGASIRSDYDLVVDGIFGIGLKRPLDGRFADAVESINQAARPVLALDISSGINSDTGAVMGCAVRAARTITFIALKPGLATLDGPDYCGNISVETLGLDAEGLHSARGHLLDEHVLRDALRPRPKNFHKGNAGDVAILGGARGMVGAALLAGRAALFCGAGRVYVGLMDDAAPRVDIERPELMLRSAQDLPSAGAVTAAGPGMGRDDVAHAMLACAIRAAGVLILDADALNLIASDAVLEKAVAARAFATLLTPHPAEAGRLLATTTSAVQADRVAAAIGIARRYKAAVALKGNGTVVAAPDGRWWINSSGHPGMASAGMGDVLTGMAASLVAQGAEPVTGLCAAVWLHGAAGDALATLQGGPLGTLAGEVAHEARTILNRVVDS
jgi:hydroxyethylthiazole kinase-like uncharacterized protein yjeF